MKPGNFMTRTPDGETVWRGPIAFEKTDRSVPALQVELVPEAEAVKVDVRYGNRTTEAVFAR